MVGRMTRRHATVALAATLAAVTHRATAAHRPKLQQACRTEPSIPAGATRDSPPRVAPELQGVLDAVVKRTPVCPTIADLRRSLRESATARPVGNHPDVSIGETHAPGAPGAPPVRVLTYTPTKGASPRPAVINIHGGGFVAGAPENDTEKAITLVRELDAMVVSVDYRLAPETSGLGAVEDCYAVLAWLSRNADRLSVDRKRIALFGGSAGGGLAASLALMARDRGEFPICFQALTYPMLDDRTVLRRDLDPYVGQYMWTPRANAMGWRAYLGGQVGEPPSSPHLVPARAKNLKGLPPAYIVVGSLDLFLEEDVAFATRLLRAGTPVQLHVLPGVFHAFDSFAGSRIVEDARRERIAALARAFATPAA